MSRPVSRPQSAKAALGGSSSAPVLANSPYAAVIPSKRPGTARRSSKWTPPPGAFNHPDLPHFEGPGPGRYTPTVAMTKPRVPGTRFGSEDRFKYLGPQSSLEATSTGMISGYNPQAATSPGPGYNPSYDLVHSSSRVSSFGAERRDTGGVAPGAASAPGPGLYTPSERILSNRPDNTPGGGFLSDDRQKYLGNVDETGQVRTTITPGPVYRPNYEKSKPRAPTVAFGGRGPGTIKKPPGFKNESPGPGSYDHAVTLADGAKTSTRPRSAAAGFGSTQRGDAAYVDSAHCFHGKVPVDMTHVGPSESPGPGYMPSFRQVKPQPQQAIFGTAKRVTRAQGIMRG